MTAADSLRSDPLADPALIEQLDLLDARILAERESEIGAALAEIGIEGSELYTVPDVKVIDNQTYEDDAPPSQPKPVRRSVVDAGGHRITHPHGSLDPRTMQVTGPVREYLPPPPPSPKELERRQERKALFRAKKEAELDRLHNAFIETLAEEGELKQALALSDNPKAESFLKDLSSPRYNRKKWTVSALAYKNGLKPSDLAQIWRRYNLAKGSITAISALPRVMQDIAEDARSTQEVCPRCDGMRIIERRIKESVTDPRTGESGETERVEWLDCPNCRGSGAVRKPGDRDARKVLTEMAEYTGKKVPLVSQTFVNMHNVESVVGDLEDLGNAPVIDSTLAE